MHTPTILVVTSGSQSATATPSLVAAPGSPIAITTSTPADLGEVVALVRLDLIVVQSDDPHDPTVKVIEQLAAPHRIPVALLISVGEQAALRRLALTFSAGRRFQLTTLDLAAEGSLRNVSAPGHDDGSLLSANGLLTPVDQVGLGALTRALTHDLQSLMQIIHGYGELAHEECAEGDEAQEYIRGVIRGARRAGDLLGALALYLGDDRQPRPAVDLNAIVEQTQPLIRAVAGHRARLSCALTRTLAPVPGSTAELRQLLLNLVVSGMAAIAEGHEDGTIVVHTFETQLGVPQLAACAVNAAAGAGGFVCLEVQHAAGGASAAEPDGEPTPAQGDPISLAAAARIVRGHAGALAMRQTASGGITSAYLPIR